MKSLNSISSLVKDSGFQRYFKNTFWMFAEKFLRLLSGLVVGVLVARYLGPDQFGLLNYALSFVALFLAFSALGLEGILVKELLLHKYSETDVLGTAFWLKTMGAIVVLAIVIGAVYVSNTDYELSIIIITLAAAALFQSFNVIEFFFQSIVQSRFAVYANIISLSAVAILKLYFIYIEASLFYFALAFTIDAVIVAIGLVFFYKSSGYKILKWKFDREIAKGLLLQSWPLILASMVITVYMKIDQIMIKEMLSAEMNGNYAAAVRISEAWYFVPMVICNSLFPAIINAKNRADGTYETRLQNLFNFLMGIALFVAIPITFLSDEIILFLFGESFAQSADVLTIHIWSGIFVSFGVASGLWMVNENLQKLSFYRTLTGAIVNIFLNFLLIPKYGINGAALTTLFSQFMATMFFDLFYKKTRANLVMKLKAMFLISPIQQLLKSSK